MTDKEYIKKALGIDLTSDEIRCIRDAHNMDSLASFGLADLCAAVESVVGALDLRPSATQDVRVTGNDIWVFTCMPAAGDVLRTYDEATRRVDMYMVQDMTPEGIEIDDGHGGSSLVARQSIALLLS